MNGLIRKNYSELGQVKGPYVHKTIIVDKQTVETGSFNFAPSAETENSENVIVIRGMPKVVQQYVAHWNSRWALGIPFKPEY
ncbi:TPA: phospholipase D-like domain-containing protein [Yersinia enterocolitica]